jgi:hypothetical protein
MTDFQQTANSEVIASYTAEQLRAHDNQVKAGEYQRGYADGISAERQAWYDSVKTILAEKVSGGIDSDFALSLFNHIASVMGMDTLESLGATYLVDVEVFGNTILEGIEVQANSKEEAEDYAINNLTVEELSVVFRLDIDGKSRDGELSTYDFDFEDIILNNTEYTVTKQ